MDDDIQKVQLVVIDDTFTPYHKGEVITVTKTTAKQLLQPNFAPTDFGPKYEKVKVRLYRPETDERLELENRTLNQEAHKKLALKVYGPTGRKPKQTDPVDELA